MKTWIDVILLLALVIVVAITAATSWPALTDRDALGGPMLRAHMTASGVLVVGLPIVAIWFLGRGVGGRGLSTLGRWGYWTLLASGWATIAAVFLCMLPVVSSERMDPLIEAHGYAGFAMCAAVLLMLLGLRRHKRSAETMLVLLICGAWLPAPRAIAQEGQGFLEKQDLFVAGDGGYGLYHIPGVLVTARGTVLAWCEAREDGGDWDKIDLLLRRSTDDGRTWSAPANISFAPPNAAKNTFALQVRSADPAGITVNNPVLIADRDGTVHFLFCVEYQRAFYCRSEDDGISWTEPREITRVFQDFDYAVNVLATGPNHGIQLRGGRLLVPVWLSTAQGNNAHHPSVTATIYSDDGGDSWHAGEIAVPNNSDETLDPNETTAVELADGRVMLNVRNHAPERRRIVVTSPDGASRWSEPRFDPALLEPICMASLIRYPDQDGSQTRRILFSNPHNLFDNQHRSVAGTGRSAARRNLAVKLSYDEARTWPFQKVVEDGPAMYSDLAVTPAGSILCFYGRRLSDRGTTFAGDRLTLARFNLAWLTDGADVGQ